MRGQILAAIGVATAIGSFVLMPKFGFVIAACLALVGVIAFGGLGVWLQLDSVRDKHPAEAIAGVRSVLRVLVLVRAGHAVLVVVRSESIDLGVAGQRDAQAELVSVLADAGTQSRARDAPDSVQQPCALSGAQAFRIRTDSVPPDDCRASRLPVSHGSSSARCNWCSIAATRSRSRGKCLPYVFLTFGEVLVATTGLEFAYSQAPLSMKGAIMAFWNLSVTIGNLWVLVANVGVQNAARHEIDRLDRIRRDRIPNVLLRRVRLRRRARLRYRRPHLSSGGAFGRPVLAIPQATTYHMLLWRRTVAPLAGRERVEPQLLSSP